MVNLRCKSLADDSKGFFLFKARNTEDSQALRPRFFNVAQGLQRCHVIDRNQDRTEEARGMGVSRSSELLAEEFVCATMRTVQGFRLHLQEFTDLPKGVHKLLEKLKPNRAAPPTRPLGEQQFTRIGLSE